MKPKNGKEKHRQKMKDRLKNIPKEASIGFCLTHNVNITEERAKNKNCYNCRRFIKWK